MSRFVRPEEQLGLHKGSVVSTNHSENPAKSSVAKPVSLFVTIKCNHSAFIHFRYWKFTVFVDLSDTFRKLVSSMPVSCALIITSAGTVWNLSSILPNNYQYADTVASLKARTENMLCVYSCHIERFEIEVQVAKCRFGIKKVVGCTWSKFVVHIEYAEHKYRNFPVFIHIEHKTIICMQAFALVLYTWAENRIWF